MPSPASRDPAVPRSSPAPTVPASDTHADQPTRVSDSSVDRAGRGIEDAGRPQIDGYELHEELHRGGQGVVYRATQRGTRREVALKVLLEGPLATPTARMRFEREIELAASLRHPGIVTILESGFRNGRYFFAMEFIDGQRLDAYLRAHQPGLHATLRLLVRIGEAVNYAHQRGVIHRDLKPSNILITDDGEPHVLDFGLAKSAHDENDPDKTTLKVLSTAGQVLGTLAYMSPEQARGADDVDTRSDVYTLGVIFYEALLERMPYEVTGALGDILNRIVDDEPYRPRLAREASRFGKQIDDELETILLKALDKERERRYQTAGSLARDIKRYLDNEPIIAKPASGWYMLRKLLRRYRLQALAAAMVLSTLLVCLVILTIQYRGEVILRRNYAAAEQRAQQAAEQALRSARIAEAAERRERDARRRAEEKERGALLANEQLRQALVQKMVQRGDLARLGGDLAVARDSYWEAFLADPDQAAARWALRQYYLESGDDRAMQIAVRSDACLAISPDGALVAVAGETSGISIRETATGTQLRWLATTGPTTHLALGDDGAVTAAGSDWIDHWAPDDPRPRASFGIDPRLGVRGLAALPDHAGVFLVSDNFVRLLTAGPDTPDGRARLSGRANGDPLLLDDGSLLVPTTAGVDRIARTPLRGLVSNAVFSEGPARALATTSDGTLLVLGDGIFSGRLDPAASFSQQVRLREEFDLLAASEDGRTIAVAGRDGRVVTIRDGRQDRYWRMTHDTLDALRWTCEGEALLTLDSRGSLTTWGPPESAARRTRIDRRSQQEWNISSDGTLAVLLDSNGRLRTYRRGEQRTREIDLPNLLQRLTGRRTSRDTLFATDETGAKVLIVEGRRIWLHDTATSESTTLRWRLPRASQVQHLDVSWDGKLAAICTQSATEDRQFVAVRRLDNDDAERDGWTFFDVAGSSIRTLTFLPRSQMLLVARSNGALLLIDPEAPGDPRRDAPAPWLVLEAAATQAAFSRDATCLALACEDGRVRLIDPATGDVTGVIRDPRSVTALGFSPSGTVLMIRFEDGTLDLYDFARMERILRWNAEPGERSLASWFGPNELLLTDAGGVLLLGFDDTDRRREANFGYALAREVARAATAGELERAWSLSERLLEHDADAGRTARVALLESLLGGRRHLIADEWLASIEATTSPETQVRLGHAAYHGGRFDLADRLLAAATLLPDVDQYTAWRLAECDYLLGRYDRAADAFETLLQRDDLRPTHAARVRLELLAALMLAERVEQARSQFTLYHRLSQPITAGNEPEAMGMMATLVIGDLLLGNEAESQVSSSFRNLLNVFKTQWLDYRDDIEFFAGELARQRGKLRDAEARYQRCLELARDDWPADWARLRLEQISQSRTTE